MSKKKDMVYYKRKTKTISDSHCHKVDYFPITVSPEVFYSSYTKAPKQIANGYILGQFKNDTQ